MNNKSTVGQFFDTLTSDYTATIERCFPRYREMLAALLDYLPADRGFSKILELGCGTGNLSVLLSTAFPRASLTVVDLSSESLDVCRTRLTAFRGERKADGCVRYQADDFRRLAYPSRRFDLIISSIALHHLRSGEKRALFANCHEWLQDNGVLAFADQFRGTTEDIYQRHIDRWRQESLAAGASDEEFQMWMDHQENHDHHDTLTDHGDWLTAAGFVYADCVWRYLLWGVVQARKV